MDEFDNTNNEINNENTENVDRLNLKTKSLYLDDFNAEIASILKAYDLLCQTYLKEFKHAINVLPTNIRFHSLTKGLDMIGIIFSQTILYTRNLFITCQTTQHSITLFLEFITQINSNSFNHLKLSVRDSILFVYKKTIFTINNELRSSYQSTLKDDNYHNILRNYIQITNSFNCLNTDQLKNRMSEFNKKITKICLINTIDDFDVSVLLEHFNRMKKNIDCIYKNPDDNSELFFKLLSFYTLKLKNDSVNQLINQIETNYENIKNKYETDINPILFTKKLIKTTR